MRAIHCLAVFAAFPDSFMRKRIPRPSNSTLTAVAGIKVGHHTLSERPTGCTVILVDGEGAAGGVSQRGGAPGTRETDLLDPSNMVDKVNAVVLSGGSAFGLDAATGTVNGSRNTTLAGTCGSPRCRSFRRRSCLICRSAAIRRFARLPIAAIAPRQRRRRAPVTEGTIGAGAGATVGKTGGRAAR